MSREWIVRVLRKARLPDKLVRMLEKLMVNDSILILNGSEQGSFASLAGLTQGCPVSCFLYIIAIDPLLQALQSIPGVNIVSGFVDDWSAGCDGFGTLGRVSSLIHEFEEASGQKINREKSAVVPSRRLRPHEIDTCCAEWGWDLRISYRERLLGIYIGLDAGINDQYTDAMDKFEKALAIFGAIRGSLGMVARILVANVFLNSLFSYANRLFFMPGRLLRDVENRILGFISPLTLTKLGFFTAIKHLYGISCELVDLRAANVAAIFANYERHRDMQRDLQASLSRWRRRCTRLVHPGVSWGSAFGYYLKAVQRTHLDTLHDARRARGATSNINEIRVLYRAMHAADMPRWKDYLVNRVRAKGWDAHALLRGLRCLPRSMPQGHRWFLVKLHLNAPLTSARAAAAGRGEIQECQFCGVDAGDRWEHMTRCGLILSVCDGLFASGRIPPVRQVFPTLMLQE